MSKWRKKLEVDAVQFTKGNFAEIERFASGRAAPRESEMMLVVTTLGPTYMMEGDWLVKKGYQFFVVNNKDFLDNYEEVI